MGSTNPMPFKRALGDVHRGLGEGQTGGDRFRDRLAIQTGQKPESGSVSSTTGSKERTRAKEKIRRGRRGQSPTLLGDSSGSGLLGS
jgi:hypothetical protein